MKQKNFKSFSLDIPRHALLKGLVGEYVARFFLRDYFGRNKLYNCGTIHLRPNYRDYFARRGEELEISTGWGFPEPSLSHIHGFKSKLLHQEIHKRIVKEVKIVPDIIVDAFFYDPKKKKILREDHFIIEVKVNGLSILPDQLSGLLRCKNLGLIPLILYIKMVSLKNYKIKVIEL